MTQKQLVLTDVYSTELAKNPHVSVLLNLVRDPLVDDLCVYKITIDNPVKGAMSLGKSVRDEGIPDGKALEVDLIKTLNLLMTSFATSQPTRTAVQFVLFDEAEIGHLIDILLAWRLDAGDSETSKNAGRVLLSLLPHTSILLSSESSMPDIEGQTFPRLVRLLCAGPRRFSYLPLFSLDVSPHRSPLVGCFTCTSAIVDPSGLGQRPQSRGYLRRQPFGPRGRDRGLLHAWSEVARA